MRDSVCKIDGDGARLRADPLWSNANGHSIYERNVWTTGQVAIGVVVQVSAGMISGSPLLKGRRWPAIVVMQASTFIGTTILAAGNVADRVKYFAYYISYFSAGVAGPNLAWYMVLNCGLESDRCAAIQGRANSGGGGFGRGNDDVDFDIEDVARKRWEKKGNEDAPIEP